MFKKRITKAIVTFTLIATLVLSGTSMAFACTSLYMGKDTTDSGSTYYGRSEDSSWISYKKFYTVREAETHAPGSMYEGDEEFTIPYPEKTLRYTMVKDYTGEGKEEMAQVGINEKGLSISGTVTMSPGNTKVTGRSGSDPMVSKKGLTEVDTPSIVLMQAETAREGAQLLIDVVETVGNDGRDMTAISDKNETWYVMTLSGHNAVAFKAPDDMISFNPNLTPNVDLSDKKNVITTKNIISAPETAGTLVRDAQGQIKIADSYAVAPSNNLKNRIYQGNAYLKGVEFANNRVNATTYQDFFIQPRKEKNYTLLEALNFLAYRGEGTEWYGGTNTCNSGGIGNDNNLENHIFDVRHEGMPVELAIVEWLSLTPPEFGVYLPGYDALINETSVLNGLENGTNLGTMYYDPLNLENNSYRTTFYKLYHLSKGNDSDKGTSTGSTAGKNGAGLTIGSAEARAKYGDGVKAFWARYQKELISQQSEIDAEMERVLEYDYDLAVTRATNLKKHLQAESLGYAKEMIAELSEYIQDDKGVEKFTPSCLTDGDLPSYTMNDGKTAEEKARDEAAIAQLNQAASLASYSGDVKEEVSALLDEAINDVERAFTQSEANAIVNQFKSDVQDYKTDARIIEEADALKQLEALADLGKYAPDQQDEIAAIIEEAMAQIDEAGSITEFDAIIEAAKAEIDKVLTSEQVSAEEAAKAFEGRKSAASDDLANYVDLSKYRTEQQKEIANHIAAGQVLVTFAQDDAALAEMVAFVKAEIDKVKTDAELTAIESQMFTVTASANKGGKITKTGEYKYGSDATYSYTPSKGYTVSGLTVNGEAVAFNKAGGKYEFKNITANQSIKATFAPKKFKVTTSKSGKGTITKTKTVNFGSKAVVKVKPAKGYKIAKVTVNGKKVKAKKTYTFKNVSKNYTVKVKFAKKA